MPEVNERIAELIKSNKSLTQKDMASFIGVPASTVNNWLKLGRSIPIEYTIPISEFLGVTCEFLLTGKEERLHSTPTADQAWLDLIHALPEDAQNDFRGAMRLYIELHGAAETVQKEESREAK